MDTVEEIKRAIQTLTEEQRRELEVWWHPAYDEWDLQMDSDAKAGKLDALSEQALKDFRTGNCAEFPWRMFDHPISESSLKTCLKIFNVSPQKNMHFGSRIPATPPFILNLLVSIGQWESHESIEPYACVREKHLFGSGLVPTVITTRLYRVTSGQSAFFIIQVGWILFMLHPVRIE